jgi:isopentenyldiphosphate isomerase
MGETAARDGYLLVQRRGYGKDTWPGYLDVSVGGHYAAGETVFDVLRETDEEIGVRCELTHLIPLGTRISANDRPEAGVSDHEFQDVFLYRDDRPLTGFVPNPAELAELLQIRLGDLIPLLQSQRASVPAISLGVDGGTIREMEVRAEEFVPTTDRYYLNVAILAQRALRGEDNLALSWGT